MASSPDSLLERAAILFFAGVFALFGFIVHVFDLEPIAVVLFALSGFLAFAGITGLGVPDGRPGLNLSDRITAVMLLSIGGLLLYASAEQLQRTRKHPSRDEYRLVAVLAVAGVAVSGGTVLLLRRKARGA